MLRDHSLLSKIKILEPQNEINVIAFLVVNFKKLNRLGDVFLKLGKSFVDISCAKESVEQWEEIGLKNYDSASILAFNTKHSTHGEMEFIFKNNKLVQSGILMCYENEQNKFICELFDVVKGMTGLHFYMWEESQNLVSFSDNVIKGYLFKSINNNNTSGLSFRMADLKYCEISYGPNVSKRLDL